MNATLLIHAIVRQTMVLIAALATASGRRSPLASVADEVFSGLVKELGEQGVGHKVIADMLGLGLRTYHRRAARLSESDTDRGRSLWEAVLMHIRTTGPLLRAELLERFHADDGLVVRSVVRDLVDSRLVYQTGRGAATSYRAADAAELSAPEADAVHDHLLRVAIHQRGPVSLDELRGLVPLDDSALSAALARLTARGLVTAEATNDATLYSCEQVVIPLGAAAGWEAAVFDHYQAMVTALVTKLRVGAPRSALSDKIGGSTFTFDLWKGHPLADRVLGYLQSMREQGLALRAEIDDYAAGHPKPEAGAFFRVTAYVGQTVKEEDEPGEDDDEARD
jgi:hypothetical protein